MAMKQERDCEVEDSPIELTGSQAAYERFLPIALELAGPFAAPSINLGVAYHNVVFGVEQVIANRERVATELPKLSLDEVELLPELCLAAIFAGQLVDRNAPTPTRDMLARASILRGKLLPAAEVLATADLMPKHEVSRIRKGTGFIDMADDLVALARLFIDHGPRISGKTTVTRDEIREASELGTALRTTLRPKGSRRAPLDAKTAQAIENRDRLFALLVRRYELVRRAGGWLYGLDKVSEHVPPLGSRVRARARAVAETASDEE